MERMKQEFETVDVTQGLSAHISHSCPFKRRMKRYGSQQNNANASESESWCNAPRPTTCYLRR